ncbi:unnamed protein product [Aphanomyces euteiches]
MFPAIERAKKRFLERATHAIDGQAQLSNARATKCQDIPKTTTPRVMGDQLLSSLWEALEHDMSGRYAQTMQEIDAFEEDFQEILLLMGKDPSDIQKEPLPLVPLLPAGKSSHLRSLPQLEDKSTDTVELQPFLGSRSTQTTLYEECAIKIQTTVRCYLSRTTRVAAMRRQQGLQQQCRRLIEKLKCRQIFQGWKQTCGRLAAWKSRSDALHEPRTLATLDPAWVQSIRLMDGPYGLAKAFHERKLCRQVLAMWTASIAMPT